MAKCWLSFMEIVKILTMNMHAIKTQNWEQYLESLRLMMPWMAIYDKNHYGKWLPIYWSDMMNLQGEQKKSMRYMFAQSITGNPYSCIPMDMWIEMTMNKGSKMKAGWVNILKNETLLATHSLNANNVNRIRKTLHDFESRSNTCIPTHKENTKSRKLVDELAVQDLGQCVDEFGSNPFDPENSNLQPCNLVNMPPKRLFRTF